MDTVKAIIDSTYSKTVLAAGGIGVTYIEFIPWLLRVFISIAIFFNISLKVYKEYKGLKK